MNRFRRRKSFKRIGLFGGSFNPIHMGHLIMASLALEQARLDRVVFVPCAVPPHKKIRVLAPAEDRWAMIRLSVAGNPSFTASDLEIKRGGISYTVDTVDWFIHRHPKTRFYFILGADSFLSLPQWRCWEWLQKHLTFIVAPRPHVPKQEPPFVCRHIMMRMPHIGLASRDIRHRIRTGRSVRYMLPETVRRYIERRGLYRSG